MSSPKAHHFVPRFYLARWTDSDGRLVVYARKNNRLVVDRLNPKSTGFEPGLYSISGVDEDKRQLIETCVSSVLERTSYPNYEIMIVDNGSDETDTLDFLNAVGANKRVHVLVSYLCP